MRGGNRLEFYPLDKASYWSDRAFSGGQQYFCGSEQDAMNRWNAAKKLGEYLNTKDIDYHLFDYNLFSDEYAANSNAMAYSLGRAMGFKLKRLPSPPREPFLLPGWLRDFSKEYSDAPRSRFESEQPNKKQTFGKDVGDETRDQVPVLQDALANPVQSASYRVASRSDSTITPAMRALNAAKTDDTFTKRYMNGDRDAVERMRALHRAAYPEPGDVTVRPAVRPDAPDTAAGGYSQGTHDLMPARQALEAAKSDSGFVKRYLDGDRSAFDRMQSLIQAAYPEPAASADIGSVSGASTPMLRSWTPETATEGLAPWMQGSLKDYLSSLPEYEGDGYSKLAPWMRDQYPAWLRGDGG